MASCTRHNVSARIFWCRPLITLETVLTDTPARCATSLIPTISTFSSREPGALSSAGTVLFHASCLSDTLYQFGESTLEMPVLSFPFCQASLELMAKKGRGQRRSGYECFRGFFQKKRQNRKRILRQKAAALPFFLFRFLRAHVAPSDHCEGARTPWNFLDRLLCNVTLI